MRILIADDDAVVTDVVRRYLTHDGMEVIVAADGAGALAALDTGGIDLAILDVMMPNGDGIEVCQQIRHSSNANLPVILLTALGEAEDRVAGLESGADDYVVKPFSPRELSLRVQSVLRRAMSSPVEHHPVDLVDGDIRVDRAACAVFVRSEAVSTTKREFDLLLYFLTHPDTVFTREELLDQVWGWSFGDLSTVTVHIKRLRAKLSGTSRIETVWGRGYRWTEGQNTDHPEPAHQTSDHQDAQHAG